MRKHHVIRNVIMPAVLVSIVVQSTGIVSGSAATVAQKAAPSHTKAVIAHHPVKREPAAIHRGHISLVHGLAGAKPAKGHTTPVVKHLVTPAQFAAWSKVAMCEEGGNWHVFGSKYSGGLGISNVNWVIFGGTQFASNAAYATPEQQIVVAMRIQPNPPDQNGYCAAW